MKKTLAVFALVAISVAVVVLTAVHGQNNNGGKFRRMRADKKIANQYIVVLKDDVADVDGRLIASHVISVAIVVTVKLIIAHSKVSRCA